MIVIIAAIQLALAGTTTVDVPDGGLMYAARVLTATFRLPFTFESIKLDQPGIHYVELVAADGQLRRERVVSSWSFQFTFDPSGSALDAAQSAVNAWNAMPRTIAKYEVVLADGGGYGFRPVELRGVDGTYAPCSPLLDLIVKPSLLTGRPTDLLNSLVDDLVRLSGEAITNSSEGFLICDADDQEARALSPNAASARTYLNQIRAMCHTVLPMWTLVYVVSTPVRHWGLAMPIVEPTDDGRFGVHD